MRLHETARSLDEWVRFFEEVWALGVSKLHSSSEYQSFSLLCDILRRLRDRRPDIRFQHMVKLADPHFDEEEFDPERFSMRVDDYRAALGGQSIADVQWMWRSGLEDDRERIARFRASAAAIAAAADRLRADGRIERLLCFPYSTAFANAALLEPAIDGLALYSNAREHDYDSVIERCAAAGKVCMAIRPFAAGETLNGGAPGPAHQLVAVLAQPSVEAAVLSSSNLDHLRQLLACGAC